MTRSRLRAVVSILLLLIVCGLAGYQLKSSFWLDNTSEASISALQSYWPSSRRTAASSLSQYGAEADKVVPALVKALGDSDKEVRLNALASLKVFGEQTKAAGPMLKEMLEHDPDNNIRKEAASLLGSIKDQAAIPSLIAALDDQDSGVRLEATRAVGRFGSGVSSPAVIDKLIAGVNPAQSDEQRDASVVALEAIAPDQERVARALADVLAKDSSPIVRNKALSLMSQAAFDFEIDSLIAALEDPSAEVKLAAGAHLARIGVKDARVVPALCKAARKPDDLTREGIGVNIERLVLPTELTDGPGGKLAQSYQTAVNELVSVLGTKGAAGREQILGVLSRVIATYQKTGAKALLQPASAAVAGVLARLDDEAEDIPLRIAGMNQFGVIQFETAGSRQGGATTVRADDASPDEVHARALWIVALGRALKSPVGVIRTRAFEILTDSFKHPHGDPAYAEAWQKVVPILAEAAKSQDPNTRNSALALLGILGPEAAGAVETVRSLASGSQDAAFRKSAEAAISSIDSLEGLKAKAPALRIAAAETLSRLDWRATRAVPSLIAALKDHETSVKVAAARALGTLDAYSKAAAPPLLTALSGEPEATARAAFLEALEAIAPGSPVVLDAHRNALHDPDSRVRKTALTFRKVQADDSWVAALGSALGDPAEEVRLAAGHSLVTILFEHPAVIPTLVKALGDDKQCKAVQDALDEHFEKTRDTADFGRVRRDVARLQATLGGAIPALRDALTLKHEEIIPRIYTLLGRIVAFARLSRSPELRKAIEPALETYLQGLNDSSPEIRQEVLAQLDAIPIRRGDIAAALIKYLERSDLADEDRQTAVNALAAQAVFVDSTPGMLDVLKPGIALLAKALDSPEAEVREAAARALGYIGNEARTTEAALHRLAGNDSKAAVRKTAENAIKAINGIAKMPPPPSPGGMGGARL